MTTEAPQRRRTAPRARGSWLLGSLPAYKRNPVLFFRELQEAHGDVVGFRLGPYQAHLVTHPDGVRHVVQANDRNYCRGRFYEKFKIFFGQGLLTLDGDDWRRHRHVAQPAFLRTVIGDSTGHVVAATEAMLERWEACARAGQAVSLVPEAMGLTLSSLSRTLFGLDVADQRAAITRAVDFGVKTMFNQGSVAEMLPSWLPTARNRGIAHHRRVLDEMVARVRAEHRPERAAVDVVGLLEGAADPSHERPWTQAEVHDELVTIFLAGQETTALALCWTLYALARHPHVREELEAEVDGLAGGDLTGGRPDRLRYTRMVVEESLRLHPPIWLYTRDALADDEVLGYHVPAGTSVLVSPYATHRRADLWERPDEFDPARFDPDRRERRPRFAYFPFGGGPRQCIGMHLALHELVVMVALTAARFRLELVGDAPVRVGEPVLSLRPLTDVVVRPRPRRPSLVGGGQA